MQRVDIEFEGEPFVLLGMFGPVGLGNHHHKALSVEDLDTSGVEQTDTFEVE